MKRYVFLLVAAIFAFTACNNSSKKQTAKQAKKTEQQQMLVGKVTRQDFMQQPYRQWFEKGYNDYQLDTATLDSIKNRNFSMTIVLGTWCPDSRREVPRMYKILDYLSIPDSNLTVICVDHNKKAGQTDIANLNIQRIPTFIIYINGQEKGRIVEHPKNTLEKDLKQILSDED